MTPPGAPRQHISRFRTALAIAAAGGVFAWFVPLVRLVPRAAESGPPPEASVDSVADAYWTGALADHAAKAPAAAEVLDALREDAAAAGERLGVRMGVGRGFVLTLRGEGAVTEVKRDGVGVVIETPAGAIDVVLRTGPVFGNAVRDAAGALQASDFVNSQEFNRVSSALNQRVEVNVLPRLRGLAPGQRVAFVGCVEVASARSVPRPLVLIPIEAREVPPHE